MANLTQLKMLEDLDGFLLVDKPVGIAFATVLKAVKRKFNLVKVGHGGSLDAMASGLFILLLGDANKFAANVMGADREYEGTMRLGLRTNTHDIHGEPVGESSGGVVAIDEARLQAALKEFRGDVFQTEPRHAAIRREGTAEYEIADTGDHGQQLAHVYRLAVTPSGDNRLAFSLTATKSLIVRTLANDFGEFLGCGACLESLRRTAVGKFKVADAVPFDRLLETETCDFAAWVMPLSKALP